MAGAEPMSVAGGADGALVLHGFTGTPGSMRGIAEQLAVAGLSVELPLLPGHGTSIQDMLPTRWSDWSAAADAAYLDLAARCDRVVVVGLSMGGTLAAWLAERYPEISGLALINPLLEPPPEELLAALGQLLDAGETTAPAISSDIHMPGVTELAYEASPLAPARSLFAALHEVGGDLGEVRCPVLLLSSRDDHVVAPSNGDRVAAAVAGPVERIWLERSYHVAPLDYDRDEVEMRIAAFVTALFAGVPG
jgi:carboxylesterase